MDTTAKTGAFKTGNSVAIGLPKAFGLRSGDKFEFIRKGSHLEIHPLDDLEKERADLSGLARILRQLEPIKNPMLRDPIALPNRSGRN
jgi:virulence-associated protein VagC